MRINLILIPFVIILGLLLSANDSKHNRSVYIVICSLVFLFIGALRSPEWMTDRYNIDTLVYKDMFEANIDLGWNEIWLLASQRYFGNGEGFDIGFLVLNKIIGWFTHSFYVYSIIADLLFFIPFGILLYRFSTSIRQLVFAFVFYIALVQVFFFGGARQIFAMGFDLLALLSVMDRKIWRAIFFFLFGVTIHFSSFLFLIPLLIVWFDVNPWALKLVHILCFALMPICFYFPNEVVVFLGEASGVERYAEYGKNAIQGGATTFLVLLEILSLFCLIAIKRTDLQSNQSMRVCYAMVPFFTLLAPLIQSNGVMIRVSLYYHLFLTLLVPYSIDCMFRNKDKRLVYFVVIGALAFMAMSGGGKEYYFFWQK